MLENRPLEPVLAVVTAALALACTGNVSGSSTPGGSGAPGSQSGGTSASSGGSATGGVNPDSSGAGANGAGAIGVSSGGTNPGGGTGGGGAGATASGGMASGGIAGAAMGGQPSGGAATSGGASGAGGAAVSTGCGQTGQPTGKFQAEMTAFGLERGYYMSVPEDYDPSIPHRLVFGYHGSNYTGVMMRQYLDLERSPLVENTIFVYPDGLPLDDQPDHIAWELEADGRDIAYFDELYAKLNAEYCIDQDRVFVNGQSFGGLMTNAVGCLRGDVVRAIAVVAGSGPRGSAACQGQVAAWLTHGMDDDSVDFESGEASRDHWAEANHCMDSTVTGDPPQCQNYEGCDAGYPVIWCPHVDDSGHQHPSFGREAVREFLASF